MDGQVILMLDHILPLLIDGDKDGIIKRGRMTENGKLTKEFDYLQSFVDGE